MIVMDWQYIGQVQAGMPIKLRPSCPLTSFWTSCLPSNLNYDTSKQQQNQQKDYLYRWCVSKIALLKLQTRCCICLCIAACINVIRQWTTYTIYLSHNDAQRDTTPNFNCDNKHFQHAITFERRKHISLSISKQNQYLNETKYLKQLISTAN